VGVAAREAEIGAVERRDKGFAAFEQSAEAFEIVDEAPLRLAGVRAAETGMGIEHRQQRQPDPCRLRRFGDARGKLADVVIGAAIGRTMQIMELADPREAALQHLDIGLRRDRGDLVGGERQRIAIHLLAPGPEIVGRSAAPLREPGKGALERVAVQIGEAGDGERRPGLAGLWRDAGFGAGQNARRPGEPHVALPALRRQRLAHMQRIRRIRHGVLA